MIKEVTMYTVICDRCGKDACEGSESSCWSEPAFVREMACEGWEEIEGKDYCPDCLTRNDDESELIPKRRAGTDHQMEQTLTHRP